MIQGKSTNENDQLRAENEEKKKKLEEEFGTGHWSQPEDSELPPEIDGMFLDHIMEFEKGWKDAKMIFIYDLLKKPDYRGVNELNDTEVTEELNRLMENLNYHQISLETLCDVDDRELYRFITEELFGEEKEDVNIPGMMSCYTYEDFHPNHSYDIERHSTDFIRTYLDKSSEFYSHELSSEASKLTWHSHFRDAFSSFELRKFEIINLQFDLKTALAKLDFDCDFVAKVEGSNDILKFTGKGILHFVYQWDFWYVDSVEFPTNEKI